MEKITLVIGGTQGEGIVSAGTILSKAVSRSGHYAFVHRTFASRIKGGHTRSRIEITPYPNSTAGEEVDLVVALDGRTAAMDFAYSENGCLRVTDRKAASRQKESGSGETIELPLSEAAETAGNRIAKTTVALGLICRLLKLDETVFEEILSEKYSPKGESVETYNLKAFRAGLAMGDNLQSAKHESLGLNPVPKKARPLMTGNYAMALGALAGGCRFVSAYPITPASEIMEYMSAKLPKLGGIMVQTEDEIAAVTMAIGASYGGARSMTSTSGPGLSLMSEGLGLAGMAEMPLVVIDVQRVGPSTGLPTKVEQSDFEAALYGGHGEYPSIILSPYSVDTCFSLTREAFVLADAYSCPVIIMGDLALGLFPRTVDSSDWELTEAEEPNYPVAFPEDEMYFRRYLSQESPRPLPGTRGGIHYVTGLEHGPLGAPDNSAGNRVSMMKKRQEKTSDLSETPGIEVGGSTGHLLMLCTGSIYGIAEKAMKDMGQGAVLGAIHRIKPFPRKQLVELAEAFDAILVAEYNYGGQLFNLLKKHLPCNRRENLHSLVKFSGQPFTAQELAKKMKELM